MSYLKRGKGLWSFMISIPKGRGLPYVWHDKYVICNRFLSNRTLATSRVYNSQQSTAVGRNMDLVGKTHFLAIRFDHVLWKGSSIGQQEQTALSMQDQDRTEKSVLIYPTVRAATNSCLCGRCLHPSVRPFKNSETVSANQQNWPMSSGQPTVASDQ